MTTQIEIPTLSSLEYSPYLAEDGQMSEEWQGKIGVYAVFNGDKILQFVGYSRDISLSLKQHLASQPQSCHWLKVQTITRPSRTILEEIKTAWIVENGSSPAGNDTDKDKWSASFDVKPYMTQEEQSAFADSDEFAKGKLLKKVARRVEVEIKEALVARGVTMDFRFNPKLKEKGLLSLK